MENDKEKLEEEITSLKAQRDSIKAEIEDYKSSLIVSVEGKPTVQEQLNLNIESISESIQYLSDGVDKINKLYSEILIPIEGTEKSKFQEVTESHFKVLENKQVQIMLSIKRLMS